MRRIETGSLVAALGAALLIVSLFLDWYQPGLTAWDAFEVWDLVLAGLAVVVLAAGAADLGWWRGPVPAVETLVLGVCALVIVVVVLINHPPAAIGRDTENGGWLGLVGALLMAGGGLMGRVGVSLSLNVDPRPAPPSAPGVAAPGGVDPAGRAGPAPIPGRRGPVPGADPADPGPAPIPGRRAADGGVPDPVDPVRPPAGAPAPARSGSRRRGLFQWLGPEPDDETEVTEIAPRRPGDTDIGPPSR
ncbi:MAG: hypothetical protein LC685_03050 [Actinobacteria bacterium]|nr:hypothetical protein [Actinomycetota bacterium]